GRGVHSRVGKARGRGGGQGGSRGPGRGEEGADPRRQLASSLYPAPGTRSGSAPRAIHPGGDRGGCRGRDKALLSRTACPPSFLVSFPSRSRGPFRIAFLFP